MVDRRLTATGEGGGVAVELSSRLRSSTGRRLLCLFCSNCSISASFASLNLFFWFDLVAYKKFLCLLLSSALFGPTSRSSFESDEEISALFSSINLTVLCCLTEDGDEANIVEHVSQKSIETLFRIVKTSNDEEEIASAMGIISNLPESPQMTEWLFGAGGLRIISNLLSDSRQNGLHKNQLIENVVAAICRFITLINMHSQKKVTEIGIIPVLVQLLEQGTSLTKTISLNDN